MKTQENDLTCPQYKANNFTSLIHDECICLSGPSNDVPWSAPVYIYFLGVILTVFTLPPSKMSCLNNKLYDHTRHKNQRKKISMTKNCFRLVKFVGYGSSCTILARGQQER